MVVLWDIDKKKRAANKHISKETAVDWGVQDYHDVATRCIGAFASSDLAQSMLQNEDAISFVAEHLMYAAQRWEQYPGGRSLRSYLNQCASWCIKRWIEISQKSMSKSHMSLNAPMGAEEDSQLYEIIADVKSKSADEILEAQELRNLIHNIDLTERQLQCINSVYVCGQMASDVARDLNVSRQRVDQCLTAGIKKIRTAIENEEKKK